MWLNINFYHYESILIVFNVLCSHNAQTLAVGADVSSYRVS